MFNGQTANSLGIYNINGQLLMTQKISHSMDIIDINVSELSSGTYVMAFGEEGVSANSKKFIVK